MSEPEVTIGVLSERLAGVDRRVTEGFAEINRRLDNLQFVSKESYAADERAMDKRVTALEDKDSFRARAIVLALVYPGILIVLQMALAR